MAKRVKSKSKVGIYYSVLASGDKSFYFTYKDNDGKKKWVFVGKYSEGIRESNAFEKRNEQLSKMRHGEDVRVVAQKKKKEVTTLNNLAEVYFNEKKVSKYRQNRYYKHIEPIFGNLDIESITKLKIKRFLEKYSETNAPATVNAVREILTAVINHSIKEHELNIINPCTGIRRLKEDNSRERYLTSDEITNLLSNIKNDIPIWLFVRLSLSTGGRAMTIVSIKKKHIKLNDGIVTLKNYKTGDTYTGYLQKDLVLFLKEYIQNLNANDFICSMDDNGFAPTYRRIQNRLKPVIDKLFNEGLEKDDRKNRAVIHSLRHTFASHLAINGVPIFTIQKLMNHAKIDQTLRYAKLAPDSGKKDVEGLYNDK